MDRQENHRKSSLILFYNGMNASGSFGTEAFTYVDTASEEADTLSVTTNNQSKKWLEGFFPEDGDYVDAQILVENWDREGDNRSLFCGKFEVDGFSASAFPETASISGITMPIRSDFNVTAKNRTFHKATVKTILSDICAEAGIELVYESEDHTVEEIEQSRQTDMNFALSICKKHNLAMKLYNSKLVVYDQTEYEKKEAAYAVDRSEMQKYSFQQGKSRLYDSVEIQYADPDSDETLTYSYTVPGGSGKRTLYINEQADSYRDAEIKAKSRLLESIRGAVELSFRVRGDTRHIAARNINITGLGRADGKYFIDKVTHSKNAAGTYTCDIRAHLCVTYIEFSAQTPEHEEASGTTYTVVKGDCLWNIAKKFYGSGGKWGVIFNANKDIIKNASLIYPGQVLVIPPK